ncbi:MAG: NADH-quinone oxidoreductase subunit NuoK [candidate division WOR-3 bacterium]
MNPQITIGLAIVLFFIGVFGVLFRKSAIFTLMSLEITLNAANLALVGAFTAWGSPLAQAAVALVMAVAAAEVALGLALIVVMARHGDTTLDAFFGLAREKEER